MHPGTACDTYATQISIFVDVSRKLYQGNDKLPQEVHELKFQGGMFRQTFVTVSTVWWKNNIICVCIQGGKLYKLREKVPE